MALFICKITGCRGRTIEVFDNKCVITTELTLGSILTSNATDGKKIIFYLDVVGVQFKPCRTTIGYLQLETGSGQMNNQASNTFSENTFTFDTAGNTDFNVFMECVQDYIADRIESYKYRTPAQDAYLLKLVTLGKTCPACQLDRQLVAQAENLMQQQAQAQAQAKAEQEQLIAQQKAEAAEARRQALQQIAGDSWQEVFLAQAAICANLTELKDLWEQQYFHVMESMPRVTNKIKDALYLERMYGRQQNSIQKLLAEIKPLLTE